MPIQNKNLCSKSNKDNGAKLEPCDAIRISRIDLKKKNYKNMEIIQCEEVFPVNSRDEAGAEVPLLYRMYVESQFLKLEVPQ